MSIPVLIFGLLVSSLLAALPLIELFKHKLIPYIKDDFAIASLTINAEWNGFEWMIGFFLAVVSVYSFAMFQKQQLSKGIFTLLISFAIVIPSYMMMVVPKIEAYSQRPAIEFYQSLSGKDVYVESLGHKSYAQYFYSNSEPKTHPSYYDINWLLTGSIDKPAYFVVKVNHLNRYTKNHLTLIEQRGGFALLVRYPVND
jgi:hypothetical protein